MPPITAVLEVVHDGSYLDTDACQSVRNDLIGKIALARRSGCAFNVQACNAQVAGAVALVVMNDVPGDVSAVTMAPSSYADLISIPVTIISKSDGDALESAVLDGATLTGTIGGVSDEKLLFTTSIEDTLPPNGLEEPDLSNNGNTIRVVLEIPGVVIFENGFESGSTSAWSTSQ